MFLTRLTDNKNADTVSQKKPKFFSEVHSTVKSKSVGKQQCHAAHKRKKDGRGLEILRV